MLKTNKSSKATRQQGKTAEWYEFRQEGRKAGRQERSKEGRKEKRQEGKKAGRQEGRKQYKTNNLISCTSDC